MANIKRAKEKQPKFDSDKILLFICGDDYKKEYEEPFYKGRDLEKLSVKKKLSREEKQHYARMQILNKSMILPYPTPAKFISTALKMSGSKVGKLLRDLQEDGFLKKKGLLWELNPKNLKGLINRLYERGLFSNLVNTRLFYDMLDKGVVIDPFKHIPVFSDNISFGERATAKILARLSPLFCYNLLIGMKKEDIDGSVKTIFKIVFDKDYKPYFFYEVAFYSVLLHSQLFEEEHLPNVVATKDKILKYIELIDKSRKGKKNVN